MPSSVEEAAALNISPSLLGSQCENVMPLLGAIILGRIAPERATSRRRSRCRAFQRN